MARNGHSASGQLLTLSGHFASRLACTVAPWAANGHLCLSGIPSVDARATCEAALASGRLSLLLALEVALTGRAAADRDGPPRVDPADEH